MIANKSMKRYYEKNKNKIIKQKKEYQEKKKEEKAIQEFKDMLQKGII